MESNVITDVVLPLSLFIIMLGMGLELKLADFTRVIKEPKAATIGVFCQMILLPLIAYLIVMMFGLAPELAIGLIVLALCPGGVTSNIFSYLARGDVALSISLTAVVSLVTPFTIPVVTAFAMSHFMAESQAFAIPVGKTILQLLAITIVPVVLGMAIFKWAPVFAARAKKPMTIFSVALLFVIIIGLILKNRNEMVGFFVQTGAASLTLNVVTLALGYLVARLARLEDRQALTIALEVGIQNGTLALLVTGTLIGSTVMTIPAITYSLLMFATGAGFGWLVNWHHSGRAAESA